MSDKKQCTPFCHRFIVFAVIALLGGTGLAQTGETADSSAEMRLICAGMGFQNGYLDGYQIGQNDARYRGQTDITTHPLYQSAERGYQEQWVYKVVYQNAFRRGMAQGYQDGLTGAPNIVVARFTQLEDAIREANLVPAQQSRDSTYRGPVIVPAGSRLLLQLDDYLTTKMNERGDPFTAVVARDLFVGNELAIPEGTVIKGTVGAVQRPGRVSGRAEMNLRFNEVQFKNGQAVALSATLTGIGQDGGRIADTEGTYEGKGSEGRDAAVVTAGAATGTVVGAIAAGGKGGLIGATIGGLVGLAGVLSTRGEDIELTRGTLLEIMVDQDLRIEK